MDDYLVWWYDICIIVFFWVVWMIGIGVFLDDIMIGFVLIGIVIVLYSWNRNFFILLLYW